MPSMIKEMRNNTVLCGLLFMPLLFSVDARPLMTDDKPSPSTFLQNLHLESILEDTWQLFALAASEELTKAVVSNPKISSSWMNKDNQVRLAQGVPAKEVDSGSEKQIRMKKRSLLAILKIPTLVNLGKAAIWVAQKLRGTTPTVARPDALALTGLTIGSASAAASIYASLSRSGNQQNIEFQTALSGKITALRQRIYSFIMAAIGEIKNKGKSNFLTDKIVEQQNLGVVCPRTNHLKNNENFSEILADATSLFFWDLRGLINAKVTSNFGSVSSANQILLHQEQSALFYMKQRILETCTLS